ncbi:MAG TPA: ScyD/ScyE family protein [Flavisolibacter sp.]|nr:ScyD/ScyE family protein [Flavisolibacter sp.]
MHKHYLWRLGAITLLGLSLTTCKKHDDVCDENAPATVTVFATGLNNPRGLKFGPDRQLYVAEAGTGGTNSTEGQCLQVPAPVGPFLGSTTGGRISLINAAGVRFTVNDQLPSARGGGGNGDIVGVADVAFIDHKLYALISGAGCSHGVPSIPNSIVRINTNNQWEQVANLSRFITNNPVENPPEGDFEPDGDWYSMINVNSQLYTVEANSGQLNKVSTDGDIRRIVDFSALEGHVVPTVVAYRDGYFYVGNLNTFPIVEGSSKIWRISPGGEVQEWATGFTTILGLTFDNRGNLYVLENTVGAQFPTPGLGRIVRVNQSRNKQVIATGLSLPTGITYGPDGHLYVSNVGFGPTGIGGGQVLKVTLNNCDCEDDDTHKVDAKG